MCRAWAERGRGGEVWLRRGEAQTRGARAEEVERLGGMACTHPAAARPRAGSGEASIGSKERSSKRDAGLGAWRLSLSVEAACVKTVAIFDGGTRTCETPQEPPQAKEFSPLRLGTRKRTLVRRAEVEAEAGTAL